MANALKCDICGGLYEYYKGKEVNDLNFSGRIYPNGFSLDDRGFLHSLNKSAQFDCCQKCMGKIVQTLSEMISIKEQEE